jgi:hypothetical protein
VAEAIYDFAGLHANEEFRATFTEPESPVVTEIESITTRLLHDRRMTEADRVYLQGKLAGIQAVAQLIEAFHDRTVREKQGLDGFTRRERPRAELAFLPRSLQGRNRTFPGIRAVQGGK